MRTRGENDRLAKALGWGTAVIFGLYGLAPIVYLLVRAAIHHESLSGADSLFAADQLQYLAWIRGSGEHILASDAFALRLGGHVYLQPMFLISGLLWRAGVGMAVSYLVWLPVAIVALYLGFRAFAFRFLSSPLERSAALLLALLFVTPADPLVGWTVGSNGLGTIAGQLSPTGALYGYFPVGIAVGLTALFMVGIASLIDPAREPNSRGRCLAWTAGAGLALAWLHPWEGETALLVVAALAVLGRSRDGLRRLAIPAAAVALPLLYYFALSRIDGAWKLAELQSAPVRPSFLLLLVALAPLLIPALGTVGAGFRRDAILWLWPGAALVVYYATPGYALHGLEGMELPLAILAVRGWRRLRWPAWLAALAVAASTLPGLVFNLHLFRNTAVADPQGMLLRRDEGEALAYLARAQAPGGVLASVRLTAAVPAYTGRRTWYGHASWTPEYAQRLALASDLFEGRLSGAGGARLLRQIGARYLLADCESSFDPTWLASLLVRERSFGCVKVYELDVPNRARPL